MLLMIAASGFARRAYGSRTDRIPTEAIESPVSVVRGESAPEWLPPAAAFEILRGPQHDHALRALAVQVTEEAAVAG